MNQRHRIMENDLLDRYNSNKCWRVITFLLKRANSPKIKFMPRKDNTISNINNSVGRYYLNK